MHSTRASSVPRSSNKFTFLFDSRDEHIRMALINQGWTQVSHGPALLQYTASDVCLPRARTKITNHMVFTRALTTKEALSRTLGNFGLLYPEISVDKFFPRQFAEVLDLHVFFARYSVYLLLKKGQIISDLSDSFEVLHNWLSEICPLSQLDARSSLVSRADPQVSLDYSKITATLEASDPQLSLLDMASVTPVFVVKPGGSSRGRGVFFSGEWSEISQISDRHRVVQLAVSRPKLINGRKFDLRLWVVVRQKISELDVFVYSDFYGRVCAEKFQPGNFRPQNVLTNWSSNKNFMPGCDSVVTRSEIENLFEPEIFRLEVWPSIREIISHTVSAGYAEISGSEKVGNFELLGFDVILDERGRPWLLEVNASPACDFGRSTALAAAAGAMADGLVRLIAGADAADGWERAVTLPVSYGFKAADLGCVEGRMISMRSVRKIDFAFEGEKASRIIREWMRRAGVIGKLNRLVAVRKTASAVICRMLRGFVSANQLQYLLAARVIVEAFKSWRFRVRRVKKAVFSLWRGTLRTRQLLYTMILANFRRKKAAVAVVQTAWRRARTEKLRAERILRVASLLGAVFERTACLSFAEICKEQISGFIILRWLKGWRVIQLVRRRALQRSFSALIRRQQDFEKARLRVQASCRAMLNAAKLVHREKMRFQFREFFPALVKGYLERKRVSQMRVATSWKSYSARKREIVFAKAREGIVAGCRAYFTRIALATCRGRLEILRRLVRGRVARKKLAEMKVAKKNLIRVLRGFSIRASLEQHRVALVVSRREAAHRVCRFLHHVLYRKRLEKRRSDLRLIQTLLRYYLNKRIRSVAIISHYIRESLDRKSGDVTRASTCDVQPCVSQSRVDIVEKEETGDCLQAPVPLLGAFLTASTTEDVAALMASLIRSEPEPPLTARKFFAPRGCRENMEKLAKSLIGKKAKKVTLKRSKLNMTLI